jgi:hypothetical protein
VAQDEDEDDEERLVLDGSDTEDVEIRLGEEDTTGW